MFKILYDNQYPLIVLDTISIVEIHNVLTIQLKNDKEKQDFAILSETSKGITIYLNDEKEKKKKKLLGSDIVDFFNDLFGV